MGDVSVTGQHPAQAAEAGLASDLPRLLCVEFPGFVVSGEAATRRLGGTRRIASLMNKDCKDHLLVCVRGLPPSRFTLNIRPRTPCPLELNPNPVL